MVAYLRFAWRLPEADAHNLLEEYIVEVWGAFDELSPFDDVVPWFVAGVRRRALQTIRRRQRSAHAQTQGAADNAAVDGNREPDSTAPSSAAEQSPQRRPDPDAALVALAGLPTRQRECLVLTDIAELSVDELAAAIEISPQRARRHIRAARRRFTQLYRQIEASFSEIQTSGDVLPSIKRLSLSLPSLDDFMLQ